MTNWPLYIVFAAGLIAVIKGGDWFVETAAWFAAKFGIPQVIVGATIISIGTTMPETVISAMGAWDGRGTVVLGTALGSILCNTGLILGFNHILRPSKITGRDTFFKIAIMIGAVVLLWLLSASGIVSRWDGLLLLALFAIYIGANARASRGAQRGRREAIAPKEGRLQAFFFVAGLALVIAGSRAILDSGVALARIFGLSELVIAATLFAVGSSLPELVTSITAALKGYSGIFIGNVIGANTFNVFLVTATAALLRPYAVDPVVVAQDIPIALVMMAVITLPAFFTKTIGRLQGAAAFLIYIGYIVFLLQRG